MREGRPLALSLLTGERLWGIRGSELSRVDISACFCLSRALFPVIRLKTLSMEEQLSVVSNLMTPWLDN